MPAPQAFRAIRFGATAQPLDAGPFIAPPYDVLDASAKARLLAMSDRNIVAIDLPHIPPKSLGPPEAYESAGATLRAWLADGTLVRDPTPAMFAYRQSFTTDGVARVRTGMACTIELLPFGKRPAGGSGAVLPHEETFSGPKQDRLALMHATRCQISPIFGLHADDRREAAALLDRVCASRPRDGAATTHDGVRHEVWRIADEHTISQYKTAVSTADIFIADGHHRYTTALNYLRELESTGVVPPDHPARRCMIVLVSMNDPGLTIWATHRVLGGMSGYSWEALRDACGAHLRFTPVTGGLRELHAALNAVAPAESTPPRLAMFDFATGNCAIVEPLTPDPLAELYSYKPPAWRRLDVALVQHLVVEEICQPMLNAGLSVKWAFPHSVEEVEAIGAGRELGSGGGSAFRPQLAVLVRPTPLSAVREVSGAGELMPQKSTFFYPKLATGLFMHALSTSQADSQPYSSPAAL